MDNIKTLLHNDWIEECGGSWGSMIVLAPKPHQEHVTNIDDFVWRMCVSYRKLNSITKPFEYPIPRCDDAVDCLGTCIGSKIHFISLDAKQGYHQVRVRNSDKEKLAFFSPDNKKYTFKVMPFGPTNAPAFYTAMMHTFQQDWEKLFLEVVPCLTEFSRQPVTRIENNNVRIGNSSFIIGSKVIIDDILIFANNTTLLMAYLECVCQVFQKFRVSFQLKKCEFLKDRVEYVGHNMTANGNCPAQSKFDLIKEWKLPTNGTSLHSFIGLINFYHRYIPYFEIIIKPLRTLERKYRRKPIPTPVWTPDLIALFDDMKSKITSSPIIRRYDTKLPTFLKTDWSSFGMGWILMQPADDKESLEAIKTLDNTGECLFDLTSTGPRLLPVAFGSRACSATESHFHSFVGEICCGRWAIAQNRKYLWGTTFYWICDCNSVKEVLDYSGSIHMVSRWAQELLGYNFSIIHRTWKMMVDVDALGRQYTPDIENHIAIAALLRQQDNELRPDAYRLSKFRNHPTRIKNPTSTKSSNAENVTTPILHQEFVSSICQSIDFNTLDTKNSKQTNQSTAAPIYLYNHPPIHQQISAITTTNSSAAPNLCGSNLAKSDITSSLAWSSVRWLNIDDILGSFSQFVNQQPPPIQWDIDHQFSTTDNSTIFKQLYPTQPFHIQDLSSLRQLTHQPEHCTIQYDGINCNFVHTTHTDVVAWFEDVVHILSHFITSSNNFTYAIVWVNHSHTTEQQLLCVKKLLYLELPQSWHFKTHSLYAPSFGDAIATHRYCFTLSHRSEQFRPFHDYVNVPHPITPEEISIDSRLIPNNPHIDELCIPVILPQPIQGLQHPLRTYMFDPHTLAELRPTSRDSNNSQQDTTSSPLLHPSRPGIEPNAKTRNNLLTGPFYIPCFNSNTNEYQPRSLSCQEWINLYSIETAIVYPGATFTAAIERILSFSTPYHLLSQTLKNLTAHILQQQLLFNESTQCDSLNCYVLQPMPGDDAWSTAYNLDEETNFLIQQLKMNPKSAEWDKAKINRISPTIKPFATNGRLAFKNNRLLVFRDIPFSNRAVSLIVVPKPMQRTIFNHYHGGPTGAHMGVYKTLYRIRLRFIWNNMRSDVKAWVNKCGQCIAANSWRNRKQELTFSWPITTPFWIIHADLWSPGHVEGPNGTFHVLNAMCDLTQFVVSVITDKVTAASLAEIFMERVILTYGMCAVVVVDDGSNFKAEFAKMCEILGIKLWPLARGNHKGNSVERYHRFLNKTQTIAGNSVGTHNVFHRNVSLSAYAWNSAPIDNTDIVRSLPAIGRELRFPMDTKLHQLPELSEDNNNLYEYLREVSNDSNFATSVLQLLIDDRRSAHQERVNKNSIASTLKVGDIVKAHVQVQSNSSKGEVAKLSYRVRGPFTIVKDLGHGSFEVQPYNNPSAATRKYKSSDLYLLPPAIFPSEPLDFMDQRFLNFEHAPIVSPLSQPLKIEMYNEEWFNTKPPSQPVVKKNQPTVNIDTKALLENHSTFPSATSLYDNSNTPLEPETVKLPPLPSAQSLFQQIRRSKHKLFFIKFTVDATSVPKWFLVQVDTDLTAQLQQDPESTGVYYCSFLAKHPNDSHKSDPDSRWWPDWYTYTYCNKSAEIIYGKRMLFQPHITPDSSKFILWATTINLSDPNVNLVGPFEFQPLTSHNRTRNTVAFPHWSALQESCLSHHLTPPQFTNTIRRKPRKQPQRHRKKPKQKK